MNDFETIYIFLLPKYNWKIWVESCHALLRHEVTSIQSKLGGPKPTCTFYTCSCWTKLIANSGVPWTNPLGLANARIQHNRPDVWAAMTCATYHNCDKSSRLGLTVRKNLLKQGETMTSWQQGAKWQQKRLEGGYMNRNAQHYSRYWNMSDMID